MKQVLVLCALVAVAFAQGSFTGSFDDSVESAGYGGTLYVCVDGTDFHGFYSEVGIMIGKVSSNGQRAVGNWYEGGRGACVYGDFDLTLTDTGFTGTWACAGSPAVRNDWTEPRLSSDEPSDLQCARLDTSEELDGVYTSEGDIQTLHLCGDETARTLTGDDNDWTASYEFVDGQFAGAQAYERGYLFASGAAAAGTYCLDNGVCGSTMWFSLPGQGLYNSWFRYPEDYYENGIDALGGPGTHSIDGGYSRVGPTTFGECRRNKELSAEVGTFYEVYELLPSDSSSPASALAACVAFALGAALAVLF